MEDAGDPNPPILGPGPATLFGGVPWTISGVYPRNLAELKASSSISGSSFKSQGASYENQQLLNISGARINDNGALLSSKWGLSVPLASLPRVSLTCSRAFP